MSKLLDFFRKLAMEEDAALAKEQSCPVAPPPTSSPADEDDSRDNLTVPKKINGIPLVYKYSGVAVSNFDFAVGMSAANNHDWKMEIQTDGIICNIIYNGLKLGEVGNKKRADMLFDWVRNGEPFLVYLENINTEQKSATIFIAFYRDKQKKLANHEQTIVKLTSYSSEKKQFAISLLDPGDELDIDNGFSDRTGDEFTAVFSAGEEIGRLPKKILTRLTDEGAAACFFEKSEYDPEKGKDVPFVRIYW